MGLDDDAWNVFTLDRIPSGFHSLVWRYTKLNIISLTRFLEAEIEVSKFYPYQLFYFSRLPFADAIQQGSPNATHAILVTQKRAKADASFAPRINFTLRPRKTEVGALVISVRKVPTHPRALLAREAVGKDVPVMRAISKSIIQDVSTVTEPLPTLGRTTMMMTPEILIAIQPITYLPSNLCLSPKQFLAGSAIKARAETSTVTVNIVRSENSSQTNSTRPQNLEGLTVRCVRKDRMRNLFLISRSSTRCLLS